MRSRILKSVYFIVAVIITMACAVFIINFFVSTPESQIVIAELPQVELREGMTKSETSTALKAQGYSMLPSHADCWEYQSQPDRYGTVREVYVNFKDETGKFNENCLIADWNTRDFRVTKPTLLDRIRRVVGY
jgi:hypothetical protein